MYKFNYICPRKEEEPKVAKIVKLNRPKQNDLDSSRISFVSINELDNSELRHSSRINYSSNSIETPTGSSDENDVTGEYLNKILIIKDYQAQLQYGDITVRKGEYVYLISESENYCLIENSSGGQGFVPKEICLDLEETVRIARIKHNSNYCKITSL